MEIDKSLAASTTTLVPSNAMDSSLASTMVSTMPQTTIVVTSSAALTMATQNLVNGLPPLPVGREFVRQYYTMMGKSPKNLYRFYSANSTLTFGNNPILVGQDKIRKDIERRELRNCHAYIIKIDSQPTLGNGVVVQVIGELSNNDEPLRPFTQTFVLSPHIPKNFYVHNEIFRYQDELYPEISLEALKLPVAENQLTTTTGADQVTQCISETWIPPSETPVALKIKTSLVGQMENEPLEPVVFVTSKSQSKNNMSPVGIQSTSIIEAYQNNVPIGESPKSLRWEVETSIQPNMEVHNPTDIQMTTFCAENQSPLISVNGAEYQDTKSQTANTIPKVDKPINGSNKQKPKLEEIPKLQLNETTSNAPMTYANVFKSSSGLLKQLQNDETASILKDEVEPIFIRSAIFTASTSSFVPAAGDFSIGKISTMDNKTPKKDRFESAQNFVENNNNSPSNNVVKSASFHQQRRTRQRRERYDECLQLFLGNLPIGATAEALTRIFERYGNILELRVLSKATQPGMRKLPNYGFLTYDCEEAVQRCLNDAPFYFPENTRNGVRLNVRPKNSDENQSIRIVNPPINNGNSGDGVRNNGYFAEKNAGKRLDKRGPISNTQENERSRVAVTGMEDPNNMAYTIISTKPEESNSLLMEDWPQLCGAGSDGGGGNTGGMRRKRDFK